MFRVRTAMLVCLLNCLSAVLLAGDPPAGDQTAISPGDAVPQFRFTDIRGLQRELSEFGSYRALVLTFTTTTCPLARRSLPRLTELYQKYRGDGVVFVAVNVGAADTIRKMAAQALELNVPFYFVRDADQSVARILGISRTPQVCLIDAQGVLRYRGRIDDQQRPGGSRPTPSRNDLELALQQVLQGQPVEVSETAVDGCLLSPPPALGPARTWSDGIGLLVQQKCAACHRPNSAAPFSLLSYEDAAANRRMIAEVVTNETMPPWYAAGPHGQFQNDSSLTDAERQSLLAWLAADSPAGDLTKAPEPPPAPQTEWRIGKPDMVISMLGQHSIPESGFVPYRYTVLPWVFLQETWVEAIEIRPLNPAVVHHCNMAYVSSGGVGEETFITGYVPGGQPMDLGRFGNGTAFRIPAGSGLGLQIHYTTTGRREQCRIQVGLRFPRSTVSKQLRHFLLDPRRWKIPPYEPAWEVQASRRLDRDIDLLGMFTHMHVRGRDMTFQATVPGQPAETLLQIPNYNFEWQLGYELAPGSRKLPAGTEIRAVAHFDNSVFNPFNPDPSRAVGYGLQTVDEMFNGFVFFVDQHENLQLQVDPDNGQIVSRAAAK
jgi:peroxiredoxin/mono/diheme cytochrome c family protein